MNFNAYAIIEIMHDICSQSPEVKKLMSKYKIHYCVECMIRKYAYSMNVSWLWIISVLPCPLSLKMYAQNIDEYSCTADRNDTI